ncbi:hypothetical protein D6D54_07475 [Spiroplasma poulsonii]|uniref:Uncharacterized protein n=1 Tax=Spiroplasma poulsonii TaxID=2138 RepID=A0A3S0UAE7_9MOLU|nr:hypothetical protein [Spiroplasma poulsonii]MBW3059322.1 hypothetical protein [Spiroplasma poulsonii]RUP75053.1 hypothetical protein D6D54_09055 [Spiroplasma poulsonii]RUP75872.1 hypothetical protein D6D54_07475 [Spiroplasma poulsonii]
MQELLQQEQQVNYHFVKLPTGAQFKVFNQLDNQKHMCNFFVHKSDIYKHTLLSNKVRVGDNFISVGKKDIYVTKTDPNWFNVGVRVFGQSHIYYADGTRIKATGYDAMIKTNMYKFHHLNTLHRQFEKWQAVDLRLRKFKNREEFLADVDKKYQTELQQIAKLKAEYQSFVKNNYSANKKVKNELQDNFSLADDCNTLYEKNKGKPSKLPDEELNQLLAELDNLG